MKSDNDVVYIEMLSKRLGSKHTVLAHDTICNFDEYALRRITVYLCTGTWRVLQLCSRTSPVKMSKGRCHRN